ncbi:pirin family protein [Nostoc sp.]
MSDHTHPHINLATVTYLFDGALMHRDSLGTVQEIQLSCCELDDGGKGDCTGEFLWFTARYRLL